MILFVYDFFGKKILYSDRFDHYFGEVLSVTILLFVALTALLFEDNHFVTFNVIQNFSGYLGSCE
jgi:hypothetical protein